MHLVSDIMLLCKTLEATDCAPDEIAPSSTVSVEE